MKPLSLNEALELYIILAPHIPKKYSDELDFAGKIVSSINKKGTPDYTKSVELMTGFTIQELSELSTKIILQLFMEGLVINQFSQLQKFCEQVGFTHA